MFLVKDRGSSSRRGTQPLQNCCNMLNIHSLISSGRAIPFTAHAASPTITMPRVKAITTGSIPGFLDAILNFAESDTTSSLAQQDSWLAQIKAAGGKLVMYGDDTWIKLFPGMFTRSDGTSSFFVSVSLTWLTQPNAGAHGTLRDSRISPRLITTSLDTLMMSWPVTTGMPWFYITLGWTILATNRVRKGQSNTTGLLWRELTLVIQCVHASQAEGNG